MTHLPAALPPRLAARLREGTVQSTGPVATDEELDAIAARQTSEALFTAAWNAWQERLPSRFRDASLDDSEDAAAKAVIEDRIRAWKRGYPTGLVLQGDLGRGKTWHAIAYANAAINERLIHPSEVTFGTENDLMGGISGRAINRYEEMLNEELLNERTRLLILDDVGRAYYFNSGEKRRTLFDRVIDWAYRNEVMLVCTTNYDASGTGLESYMGPAAFHRLMEKCGGKDDVLRMAAHDMRARRTEQARVARTTPPATDPDPTPDQGVTAPPAAPPAAPTPVAAPPVVVSAPAADPFAGPGYR